MKLCFLAPANNYHTQKWCNYFVKKGYEVHVISFINAKINGAKVHWIDSKAEYNHSDAKKMKYLAQRGKVKKLVKKISPDIIHVHYASSYGTVAAISGLNNYILSVWGSDIYEFPQKSFFHKMLLKFSLKRAKYLFSTSKAMAQEGRKYTKKV